LSFRSAAEESAFFPSSLKNKFQKSGMFLGAEKRGAKHHVSPPNHHNFTTKNHAKTLRKSQNPCKNALSTTPEKNPKN
jgi:hypothetical protein